jgi:hypothetical protein
MPGSTPLRTNLVQKFYLLSRVNADYVAVGYQVIPDFLDSGVGTLYRFTRVNPVRDGAYWLSREFLRAPLTNHSRLLDGVVHLRVRAFDRSGSLITPFHTNSIFSFTYRDPVWMPDQSAYFATSNVVPAFVELELGILEQQVLQRFKGLATVQAQRQYLSNNAARVHVFRHRVAVRNVDFSAYP